MKYASFKVDEQDAINKFLKENEEGIASDSTVFADGLVCFIYLDKADREKAEKEKKSDFEADKEAETKGIKAATIEFAGGAMAQLLGHIVDHKHYIMSENHAAARDAWRKVVDHYNQVEAARGVLQEINDGTWPGLMGGKGFHSADEKEASTIGPVATALKKKKGKK